MVNIYSGCFGIYLSHKSKLDIPGGQDSEFERACDSVMLAELVLLLINSDSLHRFVLLYGVKVVRLHSTSAGLCGIRAVDLSPPNSYVQVYQCTFH